MKLRPVSYNFKDNSVAAKTRSATSDNTELGFIAQEVEKVLPNIVSADDEGNKLINYTAIIPSLVKAVQDLQAEVNALKNNQ